METMLSGICEVASWLDWWLSTCGGFWENLPVEVRADFERLILSGSRALEFLASQGCTALGNLVLLRRDSLLSDIRSTVSIFPSPLLDSALTKMRAAANDALCSTYPPSAQDSSETCGWWRVGWVVVDWFCTGELLWYFSSCSEAVLDFFPFWPV